MLCKLNLYLLCLLVGCITFTAGDTFYIIPSPRVPCPQQRCYTLTQFFGNARSNLSSNTTLNFLPGTHILQSESVIANIRELHLLSLTDSSLETATILCWPTARLLVENIHLVQVNRLYFTGCSENKIESVYQLIIHRSTFRGLQSANGTALELVHTNAKIVNSSFISNNYGSYRGPIGLLQFQKLQEQTDQQTVYAHIGGALIINSSNVSVTGSRFEGNSAEIGGAVFSEGHSNIILTNCVFTNNHVHCFNNLCLGGAIVSENGPYNPTTLIAAFAVRASTVLVNTNFINNTSIMDGGTIFAFFIQIEIRGCRYSTNTAASGGVLVVIKSNVTIHDSYFNLNIAHMSLGGGVIHAMVESVISITKSYFYNNTALTGPGGVLTVSRLSNITIIESVFHNNSAQSTGGVVDIGVGCNLIILQCHFSDNMASQGGVVSAQFQSNVTAFDSNCNNNTAAINGGVASIQDRSVIIFVNMSFEDNIANGIGGVLAQDQDTLALVNDSIFHNNFAINAGGVFASIQSVIQLINCKFINNRAMIWGGVGAAEVYSIVIISDSLAYNTTSQLGGVLFAAAKSAIFVERSQFNSCKAFEAGGTFAVVLFGNLIVNDCEFDNNTAHFEGGVVALTNNSNVVINRTLFNFNNAHKGGAIYLSSLARAAISNCIFHENSASLNGGAIHMYAQSELRLTQTVLNNNYAHLGGAIFMDSNITAVIEEITCTGNIAGVGGTLVLSQSERILITNTNISESIANIGTIFMTGCRVYFAQSVAITSNFGSIHMINSELQLRGNTTFENNILQPDNTANKVHILELNEGGAITVIRGTVIFEGTSKFYNNTAENGAAIHATSSDVLISETVIIANNTVRYNGGGIYLYQTRMKCKFFCSLTLNGNRALHNGGGIYTVSSTIDVVHYRGLEDVLPSPSFLFLENIAQAGGGLYMEANANLNVIKTGFQTNGTEASFSIVFSHNLADFGGAILVDDGTTVGVCDSNPHQTSFLLKKYVNYTECFLQVLDFDQIALEHTSTSINFVHNNAHYAGSILFGGLLDRCIASPFAEIYVDYSDTQIYDGVSYLKAVSNVLEDTITSYPIKVCFCYNGQPDCSYSLPMKQLKKGENFTIAVVAVDQVNHTISNTTIHAYLMFAESGFGEGQLIQKTGDSCTDLTYSVTTIYDNERIVIYAEGPCRDSSISKKWIDIEFIPCTCPVGFQQKDTENTNCVCICDSALLPYVSSCNAQEETVTKRNNAWISYVNQTLNSSGYLIHNHCPFDYCLSPNSDHEIKVNLNEKNGADAQCAHNHIGTLCGACKPGFSLSLGSSHCTPCSHWHANLPVILSAATISGIVLVALLLVFNLTVAVGTLNGMIFYANIVGANSSTLFPFSSPNLLTVFISWLNLDIGIDTCFFKGMDAYMKVWIDLLFPAYLISLVILIIYISEKSTKFAFLLGKRNPVSTLATLILLSYTRLLRTIILSFSFAMLKYPDDSVQLVWLPDGTVKYLSGKHIALFIMALIIVIAGVAYTLLLFLWQWILLYQNNFLFKWANDQRLNHFLDPYHAPYVYEHRYWTGLLLLVRAALYIIAAVNVSNDPGINLLAIVFIVFGILVLKGCLKKNKIYKKWPLELIEMISFINLTFLCFMSFYLLEDTVNQRIVAYISGSIALVLFIIILLYHIIFELILKLLKRSRNQPPTPSAGTQIDIENNSDNETDQVALIAPTCSVIDAPPPGEQPLSALVEAEEHCQNHSSETEL